MLLSYHIEFDINFLYDSNQVIFIIFNYLYPITS